MKTIVQEDLKSVLLSITCSHNSTRAQEESNTRLSLLLTLFQAAFGLQIAFSASLEGSVIEMKPTAPVLEDNAVSPKA